MGVTIRIERLLRGLQGSHSREVRRFLEREDDEAEDICQKDICETETSDHGTPTGSVHRDSADDSEEACTSCSGTSARVILQDELMKIVEELCESRSQVSNLESQLELLKQEQADEQVAHQKEMKQMESQLAVLQQQAELDVAELKQRQSVIEFEMPALEEQLKSLKDTLQDLNVSERLYGEIMAIPEQKRTLRDHVLILAYQKMQLHRQELEGLRSERDIAREALVRSNDEVQRQEREVQRVLATAASQKKEMEKEVEAMAARSERLETDLKDAIVQLQVLSAKGSLYDEVKEELDKCKKTMEEAEWSKMVAEAQAKTATEERQRLLEVMKEKDYTLELLKMDKAYLSKELKVQEDMVKRLEIEKERQQEKTRELKQAKQDLYDRLVVTSQESNAAQELRVQNEIARVQEQARQQIDQARKDASDTANRELCLLREMRDAAQNDLEKAQTNLHDIRSSYEDLLLKCNEAQRAASLRDTDARSELKMKQFEIDRLHLVHEETKTALAQFKFENEALTLKVKVLSEKYQELEREMESRVVKIQQAPAASSSGNIIESSTEGPWAQKLASAVSGVIQKQLHRMEEKCLELQNALSVSEKKNLTLTLDLKGKTAENMSENERNQLLERLEKAELTVQELLADRNYLEEELRNAREGKARVSQMFQRLKDDLKKLLEARGSLDDLQRLVTGRGILQDEVMQRFNSLKSIQVQIREPGHGV